MHRENNGDEQRQQCSRDEHLCTLADDLVERVNRKRIYLWFALTVEPSLLPLQRAQIVIARLAHVPELHSPASHMLLFHHCCCPFLLSSFFSSPLLSCITHLWMIWPVHRSPLCSHNNNFAARGPAAAVVCLRLRLRRGPLRYPRFCSSRSPCQACQRHATRHARRALAASAGRSLDRILSPPLTFFSLFLFFLQNSLNYLVLTAATTTWSRLGDNPFRQGGLADVPLTTIWTGNLSGTNSSEAAAISFLFTFSSSSFISFSLTWTSPAVVVAAAVTTIDHLRCQDKLRPIDS